MILETSELVKIAKSYPDLPYHNLSHGLKTLTIVYSLVKKPSDSLCAAALVHDALYDPRRKDNEGHLIKHLDEVLSLGTLKPRVVELIEVTRHHQPPVDDPEAQILSDADMWIFSESQQAFSNYCIDIEYEYVDFGGIDFITYLKGRKKFLQSMLNRAKDGKLFFYGPDKDTRNTRAITNIESELSLFL